MCWFLARVTIKLIRKQGLTLKPSEWMKIARNLRQICTNPVIQSYKT